MYTRAVVRCLILFVLCSWCLGCSSVWSQTLADDPATQFISRIQPLTMQGDVASEMVDGIDRFLQRKIDGSASQRPQHWQRNLDSEQRYAQSVQPNRDRLAGILGAADDRISPVAFRRDRLIGMTVGFESTLFDVYCIDWPVLEDPDPNRTIVSVYGIGLLLEPRDPNRVVANVVAIGDCDQTPAQLCGVAEGIVPDLQFARRLAELNCRVIVPMMINRELSQRGGRASLTNREYVYRPAFELGRHVMGYEVQTIRAALDGLGDTLPLGIIGAGEGGRVALATAALDQRVDALCVGGSFGNSDDLWSQPIDRNLFGWSNEFGSAELLTLVAPRKVLINHASISRQVFDGRGGGAPGVIEPISIQEGSREVARAKALMSPWTENQQWTVAETAYTAAACDPNTTSAFVEMLTGAKPPIAQTQAVLIPEPLDEVAIQDRCVEQLDRHTQLLLRESAYVRREFMKDQKHDSLESFAESSQDYRKIFRDQVIGHFEEPLLPPNARVRQTWQQPEWTGYEVVLDVFDDVFAYGVLIIPTGIAANEQRPVVVCQHGLEGRPVDTFEGDHPAYHNFAAELAKRGFITFAPQNPYLFQDRFRRLQRKSNPLGKTLFSIIVPQHQQTVNWLATLPFVDPDRIAFYGLSYGGKSAMRIPALVTDYCLSICSADFNEWVLKNASTRDSFSYVGTGEYEIFEWNLGATFNYSEMASLICPRPFMVERGHFDGVGSDEWVAFEYAKVRHLYAARLGIGERTEIEWFVGPHTINGQGSFDFLHRHLAWPKRSETLE